MPTFKVDDSAVKDFSKKLTQISRSALPVAVRESLTDCAKDMKKNTIVDSARKSFRSRTANDNFFKANSSFDKATGFSISSMKATVGMTEDKLKDSASNHSVKDLVQQEQGGSINKKSLIPMLPARSGNSLNKLVRPNARLRSIKNAVNAKNVKGKTKAQKFLIASMKAGNGGYVISAWKGDNILWRINSVSSSLKNRGLVVKSTPLYSVKKGRSVQVKPHHFIQKAGELTHLKIDDFYIKRAEKAISKYSK